MKLYNTLMNNDFIINLHTQSRRRKRNRLFRLLLFLFIVSSLTIFLLNFFVSKSQGETDLISPLLPLTTQSSPKHLDLPPLSSSLEEVVRKSLKDAKGTYGIFIKNLKTNETYYSLEDRIFEAGSLYKLWIMAEAIRQIQNGELDENEILSDEITTLNSDFNIDPEWAELTSGTITITVNQALNQMITISHNYAALLLTKKIKLSSVKKFLQDNNFNNSIVGTDGATPTTTPSNLALYFEKLYKGDLADEDHSKKMIEFLKGQKKNNKLPKNLPKDVVIGHKTGEIGMFTHDAGIVYTNKGDYIIVVLSQSELPKGAEEKIANLSKAVYDYFTK